MIHLCSCIGLVFLALFGKGFAQADTPPLASTKEVQVYFSPADQVDQKLISLIQQEKKAIHAAIFCLTHRGIIKALLEAKKRGVHVELILDPFTMKARAPLRRMAQGGVEMHIWDPPFKQVTDAGKQRKPLMHNKFCLFHQQGVVWTGSFNFTSEGSFSNQENVLVLKDVASHDLFQRQFQKIKQQGCLTYQDYLASTTTKKKNKKKIS